MTMFKLGQSVLARGRVCEDPGGNLVRADFDGTVRWMMRDVLSPAPKAEREAVPEDARVGDVYESPGGPRVRVMALFERGRYEVQREDRKSTMFCCEKGAHMAWRLKTRGPAPAPSPAPEAEREWRAGDVVYVDELGQATLVEPCSNVQWRVRLRGGGLDVWITEAMRLVVPAPTTPAPASEAAKMTAGERAMAGFYPNLRHNDWQAQGVKQRARWEAAAQAVLAAQPAPRVSNKEWETLARIAIESRTSSAELQAAMAKYGVAAQPVAKVEREVVGYVIRDDGPSILRYFGKKGWATTRKVAEPTTREVCTREAERIGPRMRGLRLVRVTRPVRP